MSTAMVAAINRMSHAVGVKTVAEFVEIDAIRTELAGIGDDFGEGCGIARPVPLEDPLGAPRTVRTLRRAR